jgi:hypothetical protein
MNFWWIWGLFAIVIIGLILFAIKTWNESNIYQKILIVVVAIFFLGLLIFGV